MFILFLSFYVIICITVTVHFLTGKPVFPGNNMGSGEKKEHIE